MAKPFPDKRWLAELVDEAVSACERAGAPTGGTAELAGGLPLDFAAAARILVARSLRARRKPPAPAGTSEVGEFQETVQQHVLLLLDLRQLGPTPRPAEGAHAEVAAFLAAALGEPRLAVVAASSLPSWDRDRAAARALIHAGQELLVRFFPPGDPRGGLPLSSPAIAVFRRHLARVVGGFLRSGDLEPEALARHEEYASLELTLVAEGLSGLLQTLAPADPRVGRVRARQMARLGLRGGPLREARRRVAGPRPPEALAAAVPEGMRAFVFEQLLLAQLRDRLPGDGPARYVEAFAQAAALDPQLVVAAQVEAAAQSGDPQAWFEGGDEPPDVTLDWQALAEDWGETGAKVVDRVSTAVTENLGAMATEIKETGELGVLLTKAAAGQRLTAEEKAKVRAQLIDLAKVVPALAIFAAPGGSLLLPLLVKLLPFNVLPSAWDKVGAERKGPARTPPPGAPGTAAGSAARPAQEPAGAAPAQRVPEGEPRPATALEKPRS